VGVETEVDVAASQDRLHLRSKKSDADSTFLSGTRNDLKIT
jgi:hypothetical protein